MFHVHTYLGISSVTIGQSALLRENAMQFSFITSTRLLAVSGLEGVAVMTNGNILVCDRENHRVQVF